MQQDQSLNQSLALSTVKKGIALNVFLAASKFAAGILGHSAALVSDAVDSASDIFSNLIVMAGIKISHKASDMEHQYGHERMECVASIIMSALLALAGAGIGFAGIGELAAPDGITLAVAALAIISKEGMYWYTRSVAKKINSGALLADALHHRNDALTSVGSLIGISGAMLGYPIFDPLAAIAICLMIIKGAYDVFTDAIDRMVDRSCDEETVEKMQELIAAQKGVDHVDKLQTRIFGSRVYVDVEISADDHLTLVEAHAIAENIHEQIEKQFPEVKHCMVHINPCSETHHNF
mgnify:CR=1 FL=1